MVVMKTEEPDTETRTSDKPLFYSDNQADWAQGVGEDILRAQLLQCLTIIAAQNAIMQITAGFVAGKRALEKVDAEAEVIRLACERIVKTLERKDFAKEAE